MTTKGRILVVDDDRLVLATVAHGLSQAGYDVIDADNGDDAILLAREHRPALALLDIRMEGLSGFDVAEYLRDVAHVPFIFLSAFTDAQTRAKVAELGALAYLVKPLDVGQIVPTVDQAFAALRGQPPVAVATDPPTAVPPGAAEQVPIALGILMHRYSLTREQARARLIRQASERGVSVPAQAERLVSAVEELAGPAAD
ncbi:MAG: response regulator [Rubrivivax sp.]|nr:response regulator [Rubrivivax sp.]MDH5339808.1 response regulator [Rubrivivax sp.]